MFFHNVSKVVPSKNLTLVNVGGFGDCGFRSVAAGIIDAYPKVDDEILKKIFACYYNYFPQNIPPKASGTLTVSERMDFLLHDHRNNLPQLLINMAYVLRQIAVNKLVANPCDFPGVYADNHEETSIEAMRKPGTYIDESAIAALASALDIRIETAVIERNKELPLHLVYNKEANTAVHMQLKDRHYMPKVYNAAPFQSASKPFIHVTQPKAVVHQDRPMAEILKEIEAGMAKDRAAFEEMHDTLCIMLVEGELNKGDLLTLYVKHMPASDYLQGRTGQIAAEYDNQDFFLSALEHPENSAKTSHDEQILTELVHALARAHAIGHLSLDDLPQTRRHMHP